jgi:centrosomal CEP192-like protein
MKRFIPLLFLAVASVAAHAAVLQVGPGKPFATPCAAIAAAAAGDTIEIDSSVTYVGDVCAWTTNNLTLRGVGGGRAHIDAGGQNSQGKGIWVISGANTTVENIEFSGATVVDQNGAGIRLQADNLTVRNCYFHDNEDGILTGSGLNSTVLIEFSEFAFNGFGDGQSHNVYIGNVGTLIFRYNYSHHAKIGHLLKSRAAQNFVLYNRLSDEATGTSSYQINIPNGGLTYIIGNVIEQGPNNDNAVFIAYLEEGTTPGNPSTQMFVINNTFANDAPNGTFIDPTVPAAPVVIKNNIFFGPGTITNQGTAIKANNFVGNAGFVNAAGYDYHLTVGSPAINAGVAPGVDGTFSLSPVFQYVHPACAEGRVTIGGIDVGAYEFGGGTGIAPANGTCSTATGPLMSMSGSNLTFAAQQVGTTSAAQHVTLTNGGNAAMNISSIAAGGDFAQTNNCGATLAVGASCTVNVTFTPAAAGSRSGTVTITDSAPGSPHSIQLAGTGSTTPPPSDFVLSLTPGSSTVSAGQSASFTVTIAASGGFSQSVALSCSGAPAGATCSVAPGSANPNGTSVTAKVTLTSTARAGLFAPPVKNVPSPTQVLWAAALFAGLALLLVSLPGKRRLRIALALPALAVVLASIGCASGSTKATNSNNAGTPAGTYTLTLTGTSGNQSHSATVTVVVN